MRSSTNRRHSGTSISSPSIGRWSRRLLPMAAALPGRNCPSSASSGARLRWPSVGALPTRIRQSSVPSIPAAIAATAPPGVPIEELTRVVNDQVVDKLAAIDGVADVQLSGDRDPLVRVIIDPDALAARHLGVNDLLASAVGVESTRMVMPDCVTGRSWLWKSAPCSAVSMVRRNRHVVSELEPMRGQSVAGRLPRPTVSYHVSLTPQTPPDSSVHNADPPPSSAAPTRRAP